MLQALLSINNLRIWSLHWYSISAHTHLIHSECWRLCWCVDGLICSLCTVSDAKLHLVCKAWTAWTDVAWRCTVRITSNYVFSMYLKGEMSKLGCKIHCGNWPILDEGVKQRSRLQKLDAFKSPRSVRRRVSGAKPTRKVFWSRSKCVTVKHTPTKTSALKREVISANTFMESLTLPSTPTLTHLSHQQHCV
jgi:hypothetical protein